MYSGEEICANGTVNNELIGPTKETVAWTLAGTGGVEVVKPTFCFWGLQFVQVTGWPAGAPPPTLASLVGRALSSARRSTLRSPMARASSPARGSRGPPPRT